MWSEGLSIDKYLVQETIHSYNDSQQLSITYTRFYYSTYLKQWHLPCSYIHTNKQITPLSSIHQSKLMTSFNLLMSHLILYVSTEFILLECLFIHIRKPHTPIQSLLLYLYSTLRPFYNYLLLVYDTICIVTNKNH